MESLKNLVLGFLVALLGGCISAGNTQAGSSGVPGWYIDTNRVYPNQDYLAAQGQGSSEREARRDAAGELATLFRAKIDYESIANYRYSESNSSSSSSRGATQTIRIRSDQEISGLEYSELFRREGRVYVVAWLDREKIGKLYAERITDRHDRINELRRRAGRLRPEDTRPENLLAGFILYDYSVDLARRNQLLLEQLQIINPSLHEFVARTIDYNSVQLAGERSQFARRLSFAVDYQGDEALTFLGANIAQQFTQLGFVRRQDSRNALAVQVRLNLSEVQTNSRYSNLAWDLQIGFTQNNADGSQTSLLDFSKSGRESGISRSRAVTTLKRLLDEKIQQEFMSRVYARFAKFAGV